MRSDSLAHVRKLDETQVEAFDTEYARGRRWEILRDLIDQQFPSGEFTFLDVGGGNGVFADRLLKEYPRARGTVLDNSEVLLARNTSHPRKELVCASVESLVGVHKKYDLICVHWLLHHLVSDSYLRTRANQQATLRLLANLLTERGRMSVYENMCNGWVLDGAPGWLIYTLTSMKSLARFTRRMGANTAGVGVCFLSRKQWVGAVESAGLSVACYTEPDRSVWPLRKRWRALLHLKEMKIGHIWLQNPRAVPDRMSDADSPVAVASVSPVAEPAANFRVAPLR
jgi:hypothetical protein